MGREGHPIEGVVVVNNQVCTANQFEFRSTLRYALDWLIPAEDNPRCCRRCREGVS